MPQPTIGLVAKNRHYQFHMIEKGCNQGSLIFPFLLACFLGCSETCGSTAAESEEGRLLIKENNFPLDTYPT